MTIFKNPAKNHGAQLDHMKENFGVRLVEVDVDPNVMEKT